MRIVHLVNTLDLGGAEQVAASLASFQSRQGHSVWVVCLRGHGDPSVDIAALVAAGVEVVTLDKPASIHFGTLQRLTALLARCRIEVIHTHNHLVHHYGAVAGRRAGTPAILNTLHGTASLEKSSAISRALYGCSCRIGDQVVAVGSQVQEVLSRRFRLSAGPLSVVDNGIELSRFLDLPRRSRADTVTFGNIGRFDPVKDHANLLEAFAILRTRHPRVRLRLLGDGQTRPELVELAAKLSIAADIRLEGFSLDSAGFLAGIDIYVISSRSEGLPLSLLEAMAAATPVVATSVGEIPRIVDDAQCGWLSRPADAGALAECMERALLAPDRDERGERGRRHVRQNHSIERMARDYQAAYESLLERQRAKSSMKNGVKKLALSVLSRVGALRLGEMIRSRNLLVLSYHRVIPRSGSVDGKRPVNALYADEFEEQMAYVAKRFNVPDRESLKAIIYGGGANPRYSLAITFDDGYENNFTHALPILQRYGLHAVFFLTTNLIGRKDQWLWFDRLDRLAAIAPSRAIVEAWRHHNPGSQLSSDLEIRQNLKRLPNARQSEILDRLEAQFGRPEYLSGEKTVCGLMDWNQVRTMEAAGMTIGSHTANHQILAAVSPAEAHKEMLSSRLRIEQETGQPCWCFAYPNGERKDFRPQDELAVADAGYLCAFTQIPGTVGRGAPRFALPRIPIPDTGDMKIFRSYVSGVQRALKTAFPEKVS